MQAVGNCWGQCGAGTVWCGADTQNSAQITHWKSGNKACGGARGAVRGGGCSAVKCGVVRCSALYSSAV